MKYSSKTKFDPEQQICDDFKRPQKDLFEVLRYIKQEILNGQKNNFTIEDIDYKILFDPQAIKFYTKDRNNELIKKYSEKYEELLERSAFLRKGCFDHKNFSNVAKNLKENGFFEAEHQVILKNRDLNSDFDPIRSEDQLNRLLEAEKEKILNDKEIKSMFEKISIELAANKQTKELDLYLQSKPELYIELGDIERFKKRVWVEAYRENIQELDALINLYDHTFSSLKNVSERAKRQETRWHQVIKIFKNRFHVPFNIEPDNQEDVILQSQMPIFKYKFGDKDIEENRLLDILSTGEKGAYYLLDLIYKVQIRRLENRTTFLILDDVTDSFDYKNKYAIIEYINDIKNYVDKNGEKLFYILILTHNFDFYRTIGSRLTYGNNCFITAKTNDGIELTRNEYIRNYFMFIKCECIKGEIICILAAIPFVRNLIEYQYTDQDNDYKTLTKLLHSKPDTSEITLSIVEDVFNRHWLHTDREFVLNRADKVKDLIIREAKKISEDPEKFNKVNIENKIVLSMAIRLRAEDFMMNQIENYTPNGDMKMIDIQSKTNQTGALYSEYKNNIVHFEKDYTKILEKVVMMTPENIHINSFMYEPILDMQGIHLVELLNQMDELI